MAGTPEQPPTLTLDEVRALERSGTRVHFAPSVTADIPPGTPPAERLSALRASLRLRLIVVQADAADDPTDVQLGVLAADPMQLDLLDAQTLETCDRLTQAVRRRTDALLPRLLDPAAASRRAAAHGDRMEAELRAMALSQLEQADASAAALRHQWQGSMYHQYVRGRVHAPEHREEFRRRMAEDYARLFQALDLIEGFADSGS